MRLGVPQARAEGRILSKRTQSIRSMFAAQPEDSLSADNKQPLARATSGAVRSLKDTFSGVEKDYQELRQKLAAGTISIEIDPALVDPSPLADRFSDEDPQSFEVLKQSLAERGQEIPILVREHPAEPGRYQSAYGHRRVRALRELGYPVKAYVRALTDEDLVVAQGIENSAREDLSFIERAVFAMRLEEGGFKRAVVQAALSIDRAEASKLVAVGKGIPADIVDAIGRAPKIGRGRWQSLVDSLQQAGAVQRARAALASDRAKGKASDDRFVLALASASGSKAEIADNIADEPVVARSNRGDEIGKLTRTARHCRIQIDRERNGAFAEFVMRKLPDLYAAYTDEEGQDE